MNDNSSTMLFLWTCNCTPLATLCKWCRRRTRRRWNARRSRSRAILLPTYVRLSRRIDRCNCAVQRHSNAGV